MAQVTRDYRDARNLLSFAVDTLATSLDARAGLVDAMHQHLIHVCADQLPASLDADFHVIYETMTEVPGDGVRSSFILSANRLSNSAIRDLKERIVALQDRLEGLVEDGDSPP